MIGIQLVIACSLRNMLLSYSREIIKSFNIQKYKNNNLQTGTFGVFQNST